VTPPSEPAIDEVDVSGGRGRPGRRLAGLVAGIALGVAVARPAGAQQQSVTLDEAIRLSERVDPTVVAALGQLRTTGAGVRAAVGGYLPTLNTNANFGNSFSGGPSSTDPITGEVFSGDARSSSLSLGASASYTLFDGFRREAQLRSAKAQDREADAGLDYERAQNALRTTTTFLSALQAAELTRVANERIRRADEQFQIAVAKLSTRALTVADSLQAAAQLGQARLALLSQEAQLAGAEAQLARAIGLDGRVTATADSALYRTVVIRDTTELFAEAMIRAPQVLRADATVDRQRALVTSAKSTYMPSLTLSATTNFSGSDRNDYQLFNSRQLTLGVSWPLFNGFQRELSVAQQRASLDAEQARAADTRREVGSRLEAQLAALRTAEDRVSLSQEILATARAGLQVQLERYRIGSIDITQLNQSQQQLNQAEQDAVQARFDYIRAKAEIEAIIGRTL